MASFFPAALVLLVLFFFRPFASEAATDSSLIASIDCGASNSYTDDLGIRWTADASLINSGQPKTVPNATSFSQPMRTLRIFPSGKKNCYALKVPGGGQALVRASFLYGSYDGKNSPPTFDLEFDGNSWATVETSDDTVVVQEAIYVIRGESTSVCVVQTTTGDLPFVSAIEVRGLDDAMYSHYDRLSSALVLTLRKAVGLPAAVRYPDDPYDRIWLPFQAPNTVDVVKNQATTIDTSVNDKPPADIFQAAITTPAGSNVISLNAPLPSDTVSAYINMYFTEVAQLSSSDNRTFQVFVDNTAISDPLSPSFGGIIEFYYANFSASSTTVIQLQPTADATLPPVISAMESYIIINLSGSGTGSTAPAPSSGDSPPLSADAPASDAPVSDGPPQASDQTNSPPVAGSLPAGSAFGIGRKGNTSFGYMVKAGRIVGMGVGIIVPILFLICA